MWQPRLWRTACGAGSTNRYAGDPISSILPSKTEHDIGLFGGSCGLTPRRRCQPSSGATRAEPVFPTKREGPARRCRRHAMVAEALVPPCADRVAIRIVTRDATVYTNAPKRPREARSSHLCTLLRPRACPQQRNSATAQQRNSVHECPKTAPRDHFRRSVYTIASSRLSTTAQQPNSVHKRSNPVRRGPILPFVYTIAIPRPPTTQAHGATVYTNAPKRRRGGHFHRSVYTLCRHPGGEAHAVLAVTPTLPGR